MRKKVEMIFSSDIEGNLTPIRLRMQVDDDLLVVAVKNSIQVESDVVGVPYLTYKADLLLNNRLVHAKLSYHISEHTWYVEMY